MNWTMLAIDLMIFCAFICAAVILTGKGQPMIPDDIKARFLHEYIKSSNLEAVRRELASGLRGPAGPPSDFSVHMIDALEVVAARIWDDGYIAAEWNYEEVCNCAAWNDSECACGNYGNGHRRKTNPYKETA